ncbi:hypothetical protein HYDPIDRAFT_34976 [Hydnomerulius pinastri MD-312]|uniref:Uncharacterized protein n=1 Tax=Hydnomerulius pinastri MD-312 TaxID=994086 RepID=A0A0C2PGD3_9AGAM|nr:hypothetical protein HYDPIDRAFT_34976 [Hydnomerulius pinastri MD-312]
MFLVSLTKSFVIKGFSFREAIVHSLSLSGQLGGHSNVLIIGLARDGHRIKVDVTKYSWAQLDTRPWGQDLPLQCPQCGTPLPWARAKQGESYVFECRFLSCGWDAKKRTRMRPPFRFAISRPDHIKMLPLGKKTGAGWLKIPVGTHHFTFTQEGTAVLEEDVEMDG